MKYYCNPLNLEYKYQFVRCSDHEETYTGYREAADPSLVCFKGNYYLFPSMTVGFYTSSDLVNWEFHEFLSDMPVYDYAPDVCVVGEYLYFCASSHECGSFYRTKDPLREPFEEIPGTLIFWDPALFQDDDGRMYLYWGCSNRKPLYGVELNPETMAPLTEPEIMIDSNDRDHGFERIGEEHCGSGTPYLEGAWMTKANGIYYLQYAIPGTEFNIYGDGVYLSKSPLGPWEPAKNNPYSYHPGGFMTGAGHGSTLLDSCVGNWHMATMRVSRNNLMERRIGLWKAGIDGAGELYCDQRYGDWPIQAEAPAFSDPEWMLLSYGKAVTVSSGEGAENAADENCRTWWTAETSGMDEWIQIDLGAEKEIHAIQINFADSGLVRRLPNAGKRYIEREKQAVRWLLECSRDGVSYEILEDKTKAETDLAHDFLVVEKGICARYLRLSQISLPYGQKPRVSGIRVWGHGKGELPRPAQNVEVRKSSPLDMVVSWDADEAVGHNILWGYAPDKLYHSYLVYGKNVQKIGALIKKREVYVRVDSFNEAGITKGSTKHIM